ncbi:MAG: DNA methyltransferase [Anaerolineae bacterium]
MNTLYYGDNLDILRLYIKDESVDLIYLDPPFNSNANYNVLFTDRGGGQTASQLQAFKDTWSWPEAAPVFQALILEQGPVGAALRAFGDLLPKGGLLAYLVMMAPRLRELHRVLKPTGSIYLHCDPTASHYLKVLLDAIFAPEHFINEIVWQRTNAKGLAFTRFASNHDIIIRYAKSDKWTWNPQYTPHNPKYIEQFYHYIEPDTGRRYRLDNLANPNKNRPNLTYEFLGVTRVWRWTKERMQEAYEKGIVIQTKPGAVPALKRYLDEQEGTPVGDTWMDIRPIQSQANEALGYPTQKPEALLERIINASSNPGDVVLDPFCGCGTATVVAQKQGRQWIGIDVAQAAIRTIVQRLKDTFGAECKFQVIGEPSTLEDARRLAEDDKYQFQWWATGLVGARPVEQKKGADQGVDGRLYFADDNSGKAKLIVISVKAGHTGAAHVRDLHGVVDQEGAAIAVLISMQEPTDPMRSAAAGAGYYVSPLGSKHPRVQILTIAELLDGRKIDYPSQGVNMTFEKAPRVRKRGNQGEMKLG